MVRLVGSHTVTTSTAIIASSFTALLSEPLAAQAQGGQGPAPLAAAILVCGIGCAANLSFEAIWD